VVVIIAFIFGYLSAKAGPDMSMIKLGASSTASSSKVNDIVMRRVVINNGAWGFSVGTNAIVYGVIKKVYQQGLVDVRWGLFDFPYINQRRRREEDEGSTSCVTSKNTFGSEYMDTPVITSTRIVADDLIKLPATMREGMSMSGGVPPVFSNLESVESAVMLGSVLGLYAMAYDVNARTAMHTPKGSVFGSANSILIQQKPVQYNNNRLEFYADDCALVYHRPAKSTAHQVPCKRIRIEANTKTADDSIAILDIQVWSSGVNLARSTSTVVTQKDTEFAATADRAIDGNPLTYSKTLVHSWFELSFDREYPVDRIVILIPNDAITETRIMNNSLVIYNATNKVVDKVPASRVFNIPGFPVHSYGVYTKLKFIGAYNNYNNPTKLHVAKLPTLSKQDQIIMYVMSWSGVHGIKATLYQDKWTIPLTTSNLKSATGGELIALNEPTVTVQLKYPDHAVVEYELIHDVY